MCSATYTKYVSVVEHNVTRGKIYVKKSSAPYMYLWFNKTQTKNKNKTKTLKRKC